MNRTMFMRTRYRCGIREISAKRPDRPRKNYLNAARQLYRE